MTETSSSNLQCSVVTPEKQILDRQAEMVVINAHDGQIGILPKHSPLLCKLFPGILKVFADSNPEYFFVAGGFAEVLSHSVTILTSEAVSLEHLDKIKIEEELSRLAEFEPENDSERILNKKSMNIAEAKLNTFKLFKAESK